MHAKLHLMSIFVDDQTKALAFYTQRLGFVVKTDVPAGPHRWLTVVGHEDPAGVELLLEPDENPASQAFKQALKTQGIAAASFAVDDVDKAHQELVAAGVEITQPPTQADPIEYLVLDDTCGNLIQLVSPAKP